MPPRVPIQEPPRIERRSQSAPPTISSTTEARFRPVNPQGVSLGNSALPINRIRPISSRSRSPSPHEIHPVPRSSSSPKMQQQQQVATTSRRSYAPAAEARAMTPSPTLSDAFDERTIGNHFGRYPTSAKTSETKGKHAYKDAQKTFQKRQNEPNPPKVNSKIYLSPTREKQVAADYDRLIKSGSTEGKIKTRGRLAESGKTVDNPKKSSLELHFKRNDDPLAATLGRTQNPRMGHLESNSIRRIPSIQRSDDSSSSDSDDNIPLSIPKSKKRK